MLEKIQAYQPTIANKTEPPRGTVKKIKESQEKETKQNKKAHDPLELMLGLTQLFKVRIVFKEKCATRLNDVIKLDTNDKDFIIIQQKGNITSFYRRTDIEELYLEPQKKEQEA